MIDFFRSCRFAVCLSLLTLTLTIAIPAISQPSTKETSVIKTTNDAVQLIDRGRTAYEAGKYTEAITAWQQAEQIYRQRGDRQNQAASLNYLSLAHQKLGRWQKAETYNSLSLKLLQENLSEVNFLVLAQALNTKGSLELAMGKAETALETWQQAAAIYESAGDKIGVIGSQLDRAQALQTLGLHRRAQNLLETLQQELEDRADPLLKAQVLHSLGNTLQTIGVLTVRKKF
ncbi:tetratricopeptide repeat protein [Myxosarcina sp. GI1]|uniref:tetratricopeptide repeat protein n=1 Tax=Myxosarcina sp. GI1 TaxID=1541065 RepID=UPI00068BF6DF|nr:tetratricopeptide repeat protein [Myxosarcina sp. GI1]